MPNSQGSLLTVSNLPYSEAGPTGPDHVSAARSPSQPLLAAPLSPGAAGALAAAPGALLSTAAESPHLRQLIWLLDISAAVGWWQ